MTDDTPATIDWNPLGEVYYRKLEVYSMFWADRIDLNQYIVSAGAYGGPIALIKENSAEGGNLNSRAVIHIFTSSGQEQAAFKWDGGRLVTMGWSNCEELICVAEDGAVHVFDMFGNFLRQFSLGLEIQRSFILEAKIFSSTYGTGICVLSGDYQFFVVNNINDVKVKPMQCPFTVEAPPSSWAVLSLPDDQGTKVLMAIDNTIYELDSFQPKTKNPPISHPVKAFIEMAVSFNQKYVAMFADTGLLWIGSSNLQEVYCQYNTHLQLRPSQLVWCGSGAVVGYWDNYLMMVGPTKDIVKYFVDSKVHLSQELDGVRIIGNYHQEFLQKVPVEVEDVFKLGSMKPGAMLHDASREYERKSARVDDYMKAIKDHLQEAVHECIKAAGHEFEPVKQRSLVKAAAFGKSFLQDMRPQVFVDMCQMIRVMNNVRDFKVGIPITYDQLQQLTVPVLIDRLVARRMYYLAIQICNYLRIPKRDGASRILAHWACYKVQQDNIDDNDIAKSIADKLGDTPGISYTEIASKALDRGRTALAIKLLDYEPRAEDQVPLLMRMSRDELALQKAVDSGDTELVYMVTEHMRKNMTLGEFLMKIRKYPVALSLFIKYCKQQDRRLLIDIYYQEDQFRNSGNAFIQDSFAEKALDSRIKLLSKAKESFDKGVFQFGSQVTEEHIKLLEFQSRLQDQFGKQFLNLSVSDTLYQLIYQGYHRQAETLKKEFSIPDIRYWWTKIQALGAARDWSELEKFAKSKKSPIGYEPFVEACWKFGNNRVEAEKYIIKVPLEKRVRLFIKIGYFEQAADAAFQMKSVNDLNIVFSKCGNNRSVAEKINVYRTQLMQRR
ncbi:vacuolar protein sorting-associated protein 16 homolog [Hydractinia symbiolongicarpus]|uniref:vacuolar protein sorting-associated protein 16 homolog n=1 Tax=Hydractinia symbiolongicarpus TaxID=13093 RepID=UPI0025507313|nr:vacuolar protein sorting-associated protein 16 homolog [Hydractinia symbiolongicarpus]